jgi:hypothetical protein
MKMTVDQHGQVHNSKDTYQRLGQALAAFGYPQIFRWADDRSSAFTVLLYLAPVSAYPLGKALYVGIEGKGFFGFPVDTYLHLDYVAEKLNLAGGSAQALSVLLNGVLDEIVSERKS